MFFIEVQYLYNAVSGSKVYSLMSIDKCAYSPASKKFPGKSLPLLSVHPLWLISLQSRFMSFSFVEVASGSTNFTSGFRSREACEPFPCHRTYQQFTAFIAFSACSFPLFQYTNTLHFVYPLAWWWTFGFPDFGVINGKAAVNIFVHVFMWTYVFILLSKYLGVKFLAYVVKYI